MKGPSWTAISFVPFPVRHTSPLVGLGDGRPSSRRPHEDVVWQGENVYVFAWIIVWSVCRRDCPAVTLITYSWRASRVSCCCDYSSLAKASLRQTSFFGFSILDDVTVRSAEARMLAAARAAALCIVCSIAIGYEIMGVEESATEEEIAKVYKGLARE